MSSMWFVGISDDGARVAVREDEVAGVAAANGRISLVEQGKAPNVMDIAAVRCVNSSEMLRFMRGEDAKP